MSFSNFSRISFFRGRSSFAWNRMSILRSAMREPNSLTSHSTIIENFSMAVLARCSRCYLAPGFFLSGSTTSWTRLLCRRNGKTSLCFFVCSHSILRANQNAIIDFAIDSSILCVEFAITYLVWTSNIGEWCTGWMEEWNLSFAFYCDVKRFRFDSSFCCL